MGVLWYGLKVAVVGMVVVFIGLVILIGCIKALKATDLKKETPKMEKSPEESHAQPAQLIQGSIEPPSTYTYVPGPPLTRKDDALYAVVASAIASTLEAEGVNPEGGFAIRSVRPIEELGPKLTLKDNALYAVITAAVASTLESEGVDPEKGFAVHSVKAL